MRPRCEQTTSATDSASSSATCRSVVLSWSIAGAISFASVFVRCAGSMESSALRNDPLFGLVVVPLAMTATGLLGQWWTWLLLTIEAAIATRAWRWSWIGALETAFIGAEWAWVGATALASWPSIPLTIGAIWAPFPAALAFAVARHRHQSLRTLFFTVQSDDAATDSMPGGTGRTP